MKKRNLFMQVKAYTSNLLFNGCKWSMLITAYALIAIIIVMSSESYFTQGVYAAEVAYTIEAYNFNEQEDVLCMSSAANQTADADDTAQNQDYGKSEVLSTMALVENNAAGTLETVTMDVKENVNVSILDSVANDDTVQTAVKETKTAKAKKASQTEESQEAFKTTEASTAKIKLSSTEKNILMRIVEAEATGEDMKGKMLVANVVLNRVKSERFPDTIEDVVFQKNGSVYQFSPIKDGRYYKVEVSEETKRAVNRVLNGEDESKGALYFMSRSKSKASSVTWFDRSLTKVFKYGTHEFYK